MPDAQRNLPNIDYDREKVEETVLALLWLTLDGHRRAWKSHDWGVLDRLHERGFISDPKSKAKSVVTDRRGRAAGARAVRPSLRSRRIAETPSLI